MPISGISMLAMCLHTRGLRVQRFSKERPISGCPKQRGMKNAADANFRNLDAGDVSAYTGLTSPAFFEGTTHIGVPETTGDEKRGGCQFPESRCWGCVCIHGAYESSVFRRNGPYRGAENNGG